MLASVVVVALIALGIWQLTRQGAAGGETPTPSDSASASPDATPTATGTPTPTATPDPGSEGSEEEIEVDLDETAEVPAGPSVRLTSLEAVEGTADEPGEIAGPALRFTVEVQNPGDEPLPLRDVVVNVEHGADRAPAAELTDASAEPLPAEVAAAGTARGTYVFSVPADARDQVRITVFTSVDSPTVVFSGAAPR